MFESLCANTTKHFLHRHICIKIYFANDMIKRLIDVIHFKRLANKFFSAFV